MATCLLLAARYHLPSERVDAPRDDIQRGHHIMGSHSTLCAPCSRVWCLYKFQTMSLRFLLFPCVASKCQHAERSSPALVAA